MVMIPVSYLLLLIWFFKDGNVLFFYFLKHYHIPVEFELFRKMLLHDVKKNRWIIIFNKIILTNAA